MGLIIDNFAGGGGASTGIEMALGRPVDVAINHDEAAIAMHKANHPDTVHYCQSVWRADPLEVTKGQPVDLAWFSPDCTHFSKARGGKPRKKHIRDLAWVVVLWAQRVKPNIIMLENVEEFKNWGPLCEENKPIESKKGLEFKRWVSELKKAGYKVESKEIRACDYGAPTIRKRLFLIARRDGLPIVWPKPTHGPEGSGLLPYRTAAEIIDWSIPCPSIFARKKPLVPNTQKRIALGLKRFVFDAEEPFIVTCNHAGDTFRGQGLTEPFKTVTSSRDAHGLVIPYIQHVQHGSNPRGVMPANEPLRTVTAQPKGGGMALVSAFLAKHFGGVTGVDIRTPFPTITTRGTQNTIVTSHLVKYRGTCKDGQPVTQPVPTITAGGLHVGELRAYLIKYYGSGENTQSLIEPLHTVPTKERFGLVVVRGELYRIIDIGMRMLTPRELFRAQGFPDSYIIDPPFNGKPLSKVQQVDKCGNSVSPVVPKALLRANLQEAKRLVA